MWCRNGLWCRNVTPRKERGMQLCFCWCYRNTWVIKIIKIHAESFSVVYILFISTSFFNFLFFLKIKISLSLTIDLNFLYIYQDQIGVNLPVMASLTSWFMACPCLTQPLFLILLYETVLLILIHIFSINPHNLENGWSKFEAKIIKKGDTWSI